MQFMLVFKKPGGNAYTRNHDATSLKAALRLGTELAEESPEVFGDFLYGRPCAREAIVLNQHYKLTIANNRISYRKDVHELRGPFDYVDISGRHLNDAHFELTWPDPASPGQVFLNVVFTAARANAFTDCCRDLIAMFVLENREPYLEFLCPFTFAPKARFILSVRSVQ